jgi:hypothetical protein
MTQPKNGIRIEDRDDFEDEGSIESQEDIRVDAVDFADVLIAPNDWTVGTLNSLIGNRIKLDPNYQRRNVWKEKAKSQFIESLILGIPIPQILLAAKSGQKSEFFVLDGKQRLLAISEFLGDHIKDGKPFRLRGMRVLSELENKTWSEIQELDDWKDRLLNEPVRTTVLRGWKQESVLYEIFYRLNAGSVKLSPMELRMSLHPGKFLLFVIKWTESIGPLHDLIRKREPDPRMSDVELAIRFLAFRDEDSLYSGDLKAFLDDFCNRMNIEFAEDKIVEQNISNWLGQMNYAIEVGIEEFGRSSFCRKYSQGRYDTRFNRAVFDVLVGSLSHERVRSWVKSNPGAMKKLYEKTCSEDDDFVKSVETTTKSVKSTAKRFTVWYEAIARMSGVPIEVPNFS